ncbi:RhoGAP domain-containing protein [Salmonella sp. SAL4455]
MRGEVDPHVVAGALKLYLREVSPPLVPWESYSTFLTIGGL